MPSQGYHVHHKWCLGPNGELECGQLDFIDSNNIKEEEVEEDLPTDQEVEEMAIRFQEQLLVEKGLF